MNDWKKYRYIFACLAAAAAGALLYWNTFLMPLERDEGELAYSGWLLTQGLAPYLDAFFLKPPMAIYTWAAAHTLAPGSLWAPRLAGLAALLGTAWLCGLCAARLYGAGAGCAAALLLLPMFLPPEFNAYAANTEKFMQLPMMAVVFLYIRYRAEIKPAAWLAAGALAAAALLYKPLPLLVFGLLFTVWAAGIQRRGRDLGTTALFLACSAAGAAGAAALILAPIILKGALPAFWETNIVYNRYCAAWFMNAPLASAGGILLVMVKYWWPLLLLAAAALIRKAPSSYLLASLALAGAVSVAGSHSGHYWIMVFPLLAVIAAGAFNGGFSRREAAAVALVFAAMVVPFRANIAAPPSRLPAAIYGDNPFMEAAVLAENLAGRDLGALFVAGSEPQLYYYLRKKAPGRFVIMYPLMFPTPVAAAYQRELIKDLRRTPPDTIILAPNNRSWWINELSPAEFREFFYRELKDYSLTAGVYRDGRNVIWSGTAQAPASGVPALLVYTRSLSGRPVRPGR